MKNPIIASSLLLLLSHQALTAGVTYRVFATREGLVGHTTANGHVITSTDRFVALPSRTVLNSNGGTTYTVSIRNPANGRTANNAPVWDIGPWNLTDNYWHDPRVAKFASIAVGTPAASVQYSNHTAAEDGLVPSNPAGIDLAEGTWADLGMSNNGYVDVTYNWENPAPSLANSPALCSWGTNRLDLFVRGSDNGLWHKWIDGNVSWAWSAWEKLGDNLTSDPGVCSWGPNHIDVFVKDNANGLSHRAYHLATGGWGAWESLGGTITSAPAVCSWGTNRLDVYVKDPSNGLSHRWYTGAWSAWENIGSNITSAPGACAWGVNRNDVFVRDSGNGLSHRWYDNGPWQAWEGLGGTITSAPAVCTWSANRLEVFVKDPTNGISHRTYLNGAWGAWENIGSNCTSSPSAACWGAGRIDVVIRSSNNNIGHRWFVGGAWSAWEDLGRPN